MQVLKSLVYLINLDQISVTMRRNFKILFTNDVLRTSRASECM